jgi:transposase
VKLGLNVRTVRRSIERLEHLGHLRVHRRGQRRNRNGVAAQIARRGVKCRVEKRRRHEQRQGEFRFDSDLRGERQESKTDACNREQGGVGHGEPFRQVREDDGCKQQHQYPLEHQHDACPFPEAAVRVIDAFAEGVDVVGLGFVRAVPAATGRPGYDPRDLLKLYVYGYLNEVRSSRKLERECGRNVELMWLLRRLAPDFKTIADFRRENGPGIVGTCRAFVLFCHQQGLSANRLVALDGSKFRAAASAKRIMVGRGFFAACAPTRETALPLMMPHAFNAHHFCTRVRSTRSSCL